MCMSLCVQFLLFTYVHAGVILQLLPTFFFVTESFIGLSGIG